MSERKKYPLVVLIVDDDPLIVEQLAQTLGRRVATVHTAHDGRSAWEIYLSKTPDIIISDVNMPVMDGIELLKKIRKNDPAFPFILSTGLKNLDILIEAIEYGITAFLPKPIQVRDLLSRVEGIMKTKMLEHEVKESNTLLAQYKAIVDASSIVSKADRQGMITYANDMFCEISGFTREELVGKPHSIVRDPGMPSKTFQEMWETITAKRIWHGIVHNRSKDGSRYTVKTTIAPILDEKGEIIEYIGLREDITDVIRKDEQIRAERKKLNDILNHVDSIVAMVSKRDKLIFVNQKFFDTCGYDNLERFKETHSCICDVFELEPGYLHPKMGELYWIDYIQAHPDMQHNAVIVDKEGKKRIFNINMQKVRTIENELFVVTLGDVTELKLAQEEARAAAKLKGEFLANMSHEIRTPMNGILGFTSLLLQTELNEKQKRYVDILNGSTQTLLGIINDILDFSKLENGKLELDLTSINPIVEFERIAQIFVPRMDEKRIEFTIDIDPLVTECIRIDLLRLQQVVSNLLGNAVKFTPNGGEILFYATRVAEGEEGRIGIRIGIRDSGIGISSEQQLKIFDAFSQADSSTTRKFGGTGLGLSISSNLVSLMGGELKVRSEMGKGSDFYFEIEVQACTVEHPLSSLFSDQKISIIPSDHPNCMALITDYFTKLRVPYRLCHELSELQPEDIVIIFCGAGVEVIDWLENNNIATIVVCSHDVPLSGPNITVISDLEHNLSALYNVLLGSVKEEIYDRTANLGETDLAFTGRVLVAEDNPVNQMLIREFLQRYGIVPDMTENGQQALERLGKGQYDLVLMDVNMPVLSGPETVARIRQQRIAVPVVALTANAMAGDSDRFLADGFDDYLSKPIIIRELEKVLATYLSKRQIRETQEVPVAGKGKADANPVQGKLFDIDLIKKELPFSDTVLHKLLGAFISNADSYLLRLKKAVEKGDREEISHASHYIRGAVGNLRILPLEKMAAEIETLGRQNAEADYTSLYGGFEEKMNTLLDEISLYLQQTEEAR